MQFQRRGPFPDRRQKGAQQGSTGSLCFEPSFATPDVSSRWAGSSGMLDEYMSDEYMQYGAEGLEGEMKQGKTQVL